MRLPVALVKITAKGWMSVAAMALPVSARRQNVSLMDFVMLLVLRLGMSNTDIWPATLVDASDAPCARA